MYGYMKENKNDFRCILMGTHIEIMRNGKLEGMVSDYGGKSEPTLTLYGKYRDNGICKITLNEMEIVMDNWNQMIEMERAKNIKNNSLLIINS